MSDEIAPKPSRSLAIDAVKGVGILQVVVFHSLGQSARDFAHKGDPAWTIMRSIAWATNFAIPLFLLLSAMLLAGSLLRRPETGRFALRRISRSLWPYVIWSVIYWLLRWRTDHHAFDNLPKLANELLTGKAAYHLYFMVILFQLTVAVPFVMAALRGRKIGFGTVVILSLLLQFGAFELNRVHALTVKAPGSLLTWYIPSLLIGVWIATEREAWETAWRRWWPAMLTVGAATGAAFTVLSVRQELGIPPNSLVSNGLSVLFRVGLSLALLGAAPTLGTSRLGPFLAALGRFSLPIYLVHPAFMRLLDGPTVKHDLGMLPLPALGVILIVTAVSYAFAWLTRLLRLDYVLFGQPLPARS